MTLPILFHSTRLRVRELERHEVPLVQALFDANPAYSRLINGRDPLPDEAITEFDELPPPELGFARRWFCGVFEARGRLVGVLIVLSDLGAPGVWHLALLFLAEDWQQRGAGRELHQALVDWAARHGADWMRLGVVCGNARAERFWAACGYQRARLRRGVDTGGRRNDVWTMVRPLGEQADLDEDDPAATMARYLALVPRDRADASPP